MPIKLRKKRTWPRLIGKLNCCLGRHEWTANCDGMTGDEWLACFRCLKPKKGSLIVWDTRQRAHRPATEQEDKHFREPSP